MREEKRGEVERGKCWCELVAQGPQATHSSDVQTFVVACDRAADFPAGVSNPATKMYYEELAIGRSFRTGSIEVTADEIKTFAARYDPQPFHLDAAAAEKSVFGGLVASGWMTAALTMRLMVQGEFNFGAGVVGLGVDTLQWPRPVRAGDQLSAQVEVVAMRASDNKPAYGVVKLRTTTTNQRAETVQVMVSNVLVPRRSGAVG